MWKNIRGMGEDVQICDGASGGGEIKLGGGLNKGFGRNKESINDVHDAARKGKVLLHF